MAVVAMPRCREEAHVAEHECGRGALERVRYFQRQLLTADDMLTDQDYFREKMRRHNRLLHGLGVVCGLEVTAAPTAEAPWRVRISEGYALGPQGDEISVAGDVFLDLARCGPGVTTDPCDPGRLHGDAAARGILYVAIRYAECLTRPVRSAAACGCDDLLCEYSRVRDSYELECLTEPPPMPEAPDLCARKPLPCPPCPEEPWVVLARVALPDSLEDNVANGQIDHGVRRTLYSTFAIQEQVIHCCCEPEEEPQPVPVRVATVNPANNAVFQFFEPPEVVTVTLDKDVHANTVNSQTFQVTRPPSSGGGGPQPVPGAVTYNAATRTATFKPTNRLDSAQYTVRVRGAGAQHVTDVDELALDGNKDGTGGDDFTSGFLVEMEPPA